MAKRSGTSGGAARSPGFQDLLRQDLKTGSLRPVYVLDGPDQLRIEQAAQAIIKIALDPATAAFNEHRLDGEHVGWPGILQQAGAYPMFSGRQIVWARHADRIKTAGSPDPGEAALGAYLAAPLESTTLIISGDKFNGVKTWVKAAKKLGYHFTFEAPTGAELLEWVARAARKAGLTLTAEAAALLIDLVGGDLQALQGEIDKLAMLEAARGAPVPLTELPAVVVDQAQQVVFDLTDRVGPRQGPLMLRTWLDLLTWGSSVEEITPVLLTHLRRAALAAAAQAEGMPPGALGEATGLNAWLLQNKLAPLARRLDAESWRLAMRQALACDASLKQRPLPAQIACEQLLIALHAASTTTEQPERGKRP